MNKNRDFGIVVIAFKRVNSLNRLLHSLKNASYFGETIDLIISIDNSGNDSVYKLATEFDWTFGEKKIIHHPKNLGLRNHVLFCGGFTSEYKNICVFEDDIFVSPAFYNFAKQVAEYYENDESIAGISLYEHRWNYIANRPFISVPNEYDVFLMQQAQSWGQIWSQSKWDHFINWYELNKDNDLSDINFPQAISNWPKSSWLKYHMKYLVDNNKYFVYPKQSLSSNFSDIGTHSDVPSNCYQVPLMIGNKRTYNFQRTKDKNIYDVYFENKIMHDLLGLDESKLTIDLYGQKNNFKKYFLTTKQLDFKILKSYSLRLRPHELNVFFDLIGDDIFLYNTSFRQKNPKKKLYLLNQFLYDIKTNSRNNLFKASMYFYYEAIKIKFLQIPRIKYLFLLNDLFKKKN